MSKTRKAIVSRIFAFILAIVPIVLFCIFDFVLFTSNSGTSAISSDKSLLNIFIDLFKNAPAKLGFLPLLNGVDGLTGSAKWINYATSLGLYLLPISMVLTLIFMIIGISSGKAARAMGRAIAFVNTLVYSFYAVGVFVLAKYYSLTIDYTSIPVYIAGGVIGLSFIAYFVYSCIKIKGRAWINLLLLLLTISFSGMLVYAYFYKDGVRTALKTLTSSQETYKFFGKSSIGSLTTRNVFLYTAMGFIGISALAVFFSLIRLSTKKGYTFDLVRYIINFLASICIIILAFTDDTLKALDFGLLKLWTILTAAYALIQMIICIITLHNLKAKTKKAKASKKTKEKTSSDSVNGEQTAIALPANTEETASEEVAEAVHYDAPAESEQDAAVQQVIDFSAEKETMPATEKEESTIALASEPIVSVAPVEAADAPIATPVPEIVPTIESVATPAPVAPIQPSEPIVAAAPIPTIEPAPANYDYYNSRSFDPFVASLNDEERKEFTEIFILKYRGETRNLPDYTVGGDNSDFFRKIFIFLGQYRSIIPDKLLQKMYKFAARK